jgi:hypothetical protein
MPYIKVAAHDPQGDYWQGYSSGEGFTQQVCGTSASTIMPYTLSCASSEQLRRHHRLHLTGVDVDEPGRVFLLQLSQHADNSHSVENGPLRP